MSGGRLANLVKNTSIYAAGDIAIKIGTAFLAPLYTVLLAPEEYGVWSLAVMVLVGLGHLYNPAMHGAINRFYYDHEHDEPARRRFQGTISTFLLVWGLLLTAGLMWWGPEIFSALFNEFSFDPYGIFIVGMALLSSLSVIPKAVWAAGEKPRAFVGVNLLSSGINVFGALALVAWAGIGVFGLFIARLLSLGLTGILFVRHLVRRVGLAWHTGDFTKAMGFSLPLVPHLLAHWLLAMSDRYILEHYLGLGVVGVYGSAYLFTEIVNMVAVSMNRAWVPQFTRAYENPEERPFIAQGTTYFLLAVGGVSTACTVLAPTIIHTFYNQRYHEAADVAVVLGLGGFFYGLYYVYGWGLFFYKKNTLIPVVTVVAGLANVGLNILWVPSLGMLGAALATLVGYAVLALGMRTACNLVTRLPFEPRLRKCVAIMTATCAIGIATTDLLPLWIEWPVKLAVLATAAAALVLSGFFTPEELAGLRARLPFGRPRQ